jgi:hypothetical protein
MVETERTHRPFGVEDDERYRGSHGRRRASRIEAGRTSAKGNGAMGT